MMCHSDQHAPAAVHSGNTWLCQAYKMADRYGCRVQADCALLQGGMLVPAWTLAYLNSCTEIAIAELEFMVAATLPSGVSGVP
jgi:hypothetical protein